jgi:hypothetical protein
MRTSHPQTNAKKNAGGAGPDGRKIKTSKKVLHSFGNPKEKRKKPHHNKKVVK